MLEKSRLEELNERISQLLSLRKEQERQLTEAEKLKRKIADKIKQTDVTLGKLYQERAGQKTLF